jgi:hypothetical protein
MNAQSAASAAGVLSAADLDVNRSGALSDSQRRNLRSMDRGIRKQDLVFAVLAATIGVILLTATGPAPNAWARPFAGAAFLAAAAFELYRATPMGDALTRDLWSGRVQTLDGAVLKSHYSGRQMTFYYLEVAGRRFDVGHATYEAAPDAGYVRLFFLPRSHKLVNLERLADAPLPPGEVTPQEMIQTMAAAYRTRDHVQKAETMARLGAMEDAVKSEFTAPAAPPPAAERDPRPLAEAILGTWKLGVMSLSFMPDGTVVAVLPNGPQRGRWSIGSDGRLHADAMGRDIAGQAWVAGGLLTVEADGGAMTFHRATS